MLFLLKLYLILGLLHFFLVFGFVCLTSHFDWRTIKKQKNVFLYMFLCYPHLYVRHFRKKYLAAAALALLFAPLPGLTAPTPEGCDTWIAMNRAAHISAINREAVKIAASTDLSPEQKTCLVKQVPKVLHDTMQVCVFQDIQVPMEEFRESLGVYLSMLCLHRTIL